MRRSIVTAVGVRNKQTLRRQTSNMSTVSMVSESPTEISVPDEIPDGGRDFSMLDESTLTTTTNINFEEQASIAQKHDAPPEARYQAAKYMILKSGIETSNISDPYLRKMKQDKYIVQGLKVIKSLAEPKALLRQKGYAEAQMFLGKCYIKGLLGMRQDPRKAFKLFYQAAKGGGSVEGWFQVGMCYERGVGMGQDSLKALQCFKTAAGGGHVEGMYRAGNFLVHHPMHQATSDEGMGFLRKAAKREHVKALHELALLMVREGSEFTEQEKLGAGKMIESSAQLGYAPAQYEIGQCYEYGWLGFRRDEQKTFQWYSKAASQDYGPAELVLAGWYQGGHEQVAPKDRVKSFAYAKKAADKGIPEAEYIIGVFYETGNGVKKDLTESKRWFLRSACQGHEKAKHRLTELSRHKT